MLAIGSTSEAIGQATPPVVSSQSVVLLLYRIYPLVDVWHPTREPYIGPLYCWRLTFYGYYISIKLFPILPAHQTAPEKCVGKIALLFLVCVCVCYTCPIVVRLDTHTPATKRSYCSQKKGSLWDTQSVLPFSGYPVQPARHVNPCERVLINIDG